jgi:hypothetical protein
MQKDRFDSDDNRLAAPQPLPSILDLARQAGAASGRADDLCDQSANARDDRVTLLYDRSDALRDLLLTFPAKTLGDAAAQLYAGFRLAEEMEVDLPPEERRQCVIKIRRAFLSALPLVAEAAGLDLAEIQAQRIADLAAGEFPADA